MARVAVSGAVAVGKSRLCTELTAAHPRIDMHHEDVRELRLLPKFYADPARYSFSSRAEFLAIKGTELAKSTDEPGRTKLFDRALPELITFAAVMNESGVMQDDEFAVYRALHALLLDSLPTLDAVIWVRCDTDVCLQRIKERGRPFEQGIDASYLDRLDDEYRRWCQGVGQSLPLLRLDTTRPHLGRIELVTGWLEGQGLLCAD